MPAKTENAEHEGETPGVHGETWPVRDVFRRLDRNHGAFYIRVTIFKKITP